MREYIFDFLSSFGLSPKVMILLLSTLPVTELRASIPIGILVLKQDVKIVFLFSIIGNMIPIVPIYFFLQPVSRALSKTKYMRMFFDWFFKKAKKKSGLIEKYETIGLMLFVCIPFPGTGVWTGCTIASLLRMRFLPTFIAATLGVIIAAVIVTVLTIWGKAVF